jgi:hypothetical protein
MNHHRGNANVPASFGELPSNVNHEHVPCVT